MMRPRYLLGQILLAVIIFAALLRVGNAALPVFWNSVTGFQSRGVTFANLKVAYDSSNQTGVPQTNGTSVYCSDCQIGTNCAGGGTGAWAAMLGGNWNCGNNTGNTIPDTLMVNWAGIIVVQAAPYSAAGDDVQDDTTAIQSAFTDAASEKKIVFFPAGTYKTTSTISSAGVPFFGAGPGLSVIDCRGISPCVKGTAPYDDSWISNIGITLAGNSNASVDMIDLQLGAERSRFDHISLTCKAAAGNNGLIIRGVNPNTSLANNSQYNNYITLIHSTSIDTECPGKAIYLYGQDVTNARANANRVMGSTLDGFVEDLFVDGDGNYFAGNTFNGPAATAAIHIQGDTQADHNVIVGNYFDSAITGSKILLDGDANMVSGTLVASILENEGVLTAAHIATTGANAANVHWQLFSNQILLGSPTPSSVAGNNTTQKISGASDDGVTLFAGSNLDTAAKLFASGPSYSGGAASVPNGGGLGLMCNTAATSTAPMNCLEWGGTANGATYAATGGVDTSGNLIVADGAGDVSGYLRIGPRNSNEAAGDISFSRADVATGKMWFGADGTVAMDRGLFSADQVTLTGAFWTNDGLRYKTIYSAAGTAVPTCNASHAHLRVCASDSTACTSGTNYTSGGATACELWCNSANWVESGSGC